MLKKEQVVELRADRMFFRSAASREPWNFATEPGSNRICSPETLICLYAEERTHRRIVSQSEQLLGQGKRIRSDQIFGEHMAFRHIARFSYDALSSEASPYRAMCLIIGASLRDQYQKSDRTPSYMQSLLEELDEKETAGSDRTE